MPSLSLARPIYALGSHTIAQAPKIYPFLGQTDPTTRKSCELVAGPLSVCEVKSGRDLGVSQNAIWPPFQSICKGKPKGNQPCLGTPTLNGPVVIYHSIVLRFLHPKCSFSYPRFEKPPYSNWCRVCPSSLPCRPRAGQSQLAQPHGSMSHLNHWPNNRGGGLNRDLDAQKLTCFRFPWGKKPPPNKGTLQTADTEWNISRVLKIDQ